MKRVIPEHLVYPKIFDFLHKPSNPYTDPIAIPKRKIISNGFKIIFFISKNSYSFPFSIPASR
jgi:hypothetical protein